MSGAPVTVEVTPPVTPAEANTTDRQEQTIPYARFKEVNDQLAELKRKDQERTDKERQETEKRAKEQGQYAELLETRTKELDALKPQVETATSRAQAVEAVMAEQVKERIKALNPDAKEAFALLGEDVLVQFKALPTFEKWGSTPHSPGTSSGPRGSGAGTTVGGPSLEDMKNEKRARIGGL